MFLPTVPRFMAKEIKQGYLIYLCEGLHLVIWCILGEMSINHGVSLSVETLYKW